MNLKLALLIKYVLEVNYMITYILAEPANVALKIFLEHF